MIIPPMVPAQSTPVNTGYGETALTYFEKGWAPLPMPKGKNAKSNPPVGFTGREGKYPERQRVEFWASNLASNNLAIRVPRNVIGLDVDAYDDKPGGKTLAELEARCGELPTTWRSTSRTDGISGIYLFRAELPEDRKWQDQPAVEIVRWNHRYAMSYPSVHRTGRTYRWYYGDAAIDLPDLPTPEELPELPPEWLEALTVPRARVDHEKVTDTDPRFTEGQPGTRYGLAALGRELAELQAIWDKDEEAFNPKLNNCCFAVGQLVGGGEIDEVHARVELENFMTENSVPADQYKTLDSGFNSGLDNPRNSGSKDVAPKSEQEVDARDVWPNPGTPMPVARKFYNELRHEDGAPTLRRYKGEWVTWDVSGWCSVDEEEGVKSKLYTRLEHSVFEQIITEGGKEVVRYPNWNPTPTNVGAATEALKAVVQTKGKLIAPVWIDDEGNEDQSRGVDPKDVIPFSNGLYLVEGKKLLPPTPRFFTFNGIPHEYNPNAPEPEYWLEFMDSIWGHEPDNIQTTKQIGGLLLSGRTEMQKFFTFAGESRGGKGVIRDAFITALGAHNCFPFEIANFSRGFGLQEAIGKSFMYEPDFRVEDHDQYLQQAIGTALKITGEDPLSVEQKYKTKWTGMLRARIAFFCNYFPKVDDPSRALPNRLIPLMLTKSFAGREDTNLKPRIRSQMPQLINYFVQGYHELREQGEFTLSESSRAYLESIKIDSSPVKSFMESRCESGPFDEFEVTKSDLWQAWVQYQMHVLGLRISEADSQNAFTGKLKKAFPAIRDRRGKYTENRQRVWGGYRLKNK